MPSQDVMTSKFDLGVVLPGTTEPLRAKLFMPSSHTMIFVDEISTGTNDMKVWAELMTELLWRFHLEPGNVVWVRQKNHRRGGYVLSRIVADFYEGRYYDVRFTNLQPQVDKQFRRVLENPRARELVESPGIFSAFPKPRVLTIERLKLMLAVAVVLFIILALVFFSWFRSSQGADYDYWASRVNTLSQDRASALSAAEAARTRADKAEANVATLQKQYVLMEDKLEQAQADLAAAKPPAVDTNPAPASNQPPAAQPQVRQALPADTGAGGKDINLEGR